jgi:predicted secreted hydrolase
MTGRRLSDRGRLRYSYTRLHLSGTIRDNGAAKRVSGIGWMDHQWGELQTARVGWDWFSVQLDDGSDIMFSVVRDDAGSTFLRYGTYMSPEGSMLPIASEDVEIDSLETWRSPTTGIQYPVNWGMVIRSLGLSIQLTPVIFNAEFHTFDRNTPPYWEGEVSVEGHRHGAPIAGLGYVELVGYRR